jgi:hypothetical protein
MADLDPARLVFVEKCGTWGPVTATDAAGWFPHAGYRTRQAS